MEMSLEHLNIERLSQRESARKESEKKQAVRKEENQETMELKPARAEIILQKEYSVFLNMLKENQRHEQWIC